LVEGALAAVVFFAGAGTGAAATAGGGATLVVTTGDGVGTGAEVVWVGSVRGALDVGCAT